MNQMMQKFGVGASALRKEDDSFLRGKGRYTDDIQIEGCLRGFVVRSPIANGGFKIGSLKEAKSAPGVRLVLTGKDVAHLGALQCFRKPKGGVARDIPILCEREVSHVGDAVAFIVADTLFEAQSAAEKIDIDWLPRPAIASTAKALDKGAPRAAKGLKSNLAYVEHYGNQAKTARAFAKAAHVTRIAFHNNRLVPNYLETRAAVGEWNANENRYVLTCGTQGVHNVRKNLAEKVFHIPKRQLRVVTPDVGGGFGPKGMTYREYALVLEAAKRLGHPVKWICERGEQFLSDAQGRDNVVEAEMAMDKDGRFLGLRATITANLGAYMHEYGALVPEFCATMATGCYDIRAADIEIRGIYTNTVPVDAYRGAGRPEAAFMIERLADECARDLGLAPDEIRRRNFIKPEQFPYRTQFGRLYDVGNFAGPMHKAMDAAGWAGFESTPRCLQIQRQTARHRPCHLHRGLRLRRLRARLRPAAPGRHCRTAHRHAVDRTGPCDRLCPVRRRKTQSRYFEDRSAPGRHGRIAARRRHRRVALDSARRCFGEPGGRGAGAEDQECGRR